MAVKTFEITFPNYIKRSFQINLTDEDSFQNLISILQLVKETLQHKANLMDIRYSFSAENHNKDETVDIQFSKKKLI